MFGLFTCTFLLIVIFLLRLIDLSYSEHRHGQGYGRNIRTAKRVQDRRSVWAKHIDERLKAPKAKDVDQWLSAPNRFDLPNVDTYKEK
jgi:hypothetical protein